MISYCIRRCLMSASRLALPPRAVRPTTPPSPGHQVCCLSFGTKAPATTTSTTAAAAGYRMDGRGVVRMSGRDTVDLLQGLVTSDLTEFGDSSQGVAAQYCMMLNVQGRVLFDLIMYRHEEPRGSVSFLIECDASLKEDFIRAVKRYRIRKKVDIADVSDEFKVWAVPSDLDPTQPLVGPNEGDGEVAEGEKDVATETRAVEVASAVVSVADPRVPLFGQRVVFRSGEETLEVREEEGEGEGGGQYDSLRYMWGIPEGPRDLPYAACLPLESNLTIMNGVNFLKGCYIGQELTARTHHTGVIRKRLLPLVLDSPASDVDSDAPISLETGKTAGKVRGIVGRQGLGLIRLEHHSKPLFVGAKEGGRVALTAYRPGWWPQELRT